MPNTCSSCFHCGLPADTAIMRTIKQQQEVFCCLGCANVAKIIHELGLESFYLQQEKSQQAVTPLQYAQDFYDLVAFQDHYLTHNTPAKKSIHLSAQSIHCAACVWLIEKTLNQLDGVELVRVNLSQKRIYLVWSKAISLSTLMVKLASFGYSAIPYEQNQIQASNDIAHKKLLYRISFASFAMMNLLWISIALYTGAAGGKYEWFFQAVGFSLATPTLFYSGFGFLKNAFIGLKNRHMNMDLPISIGALTTYGYSSYVLFAQLPNAGTYFDTVVNFIFVILLGRYLESLAKKTALNGYQTLQQSQPALACVVGKTNTNQQDTNQQDTNQQDNKTQYQPIASIQPNSKILVKNGENIPLDAKLLSPATLDESLLTGESTPVYKIKGDDIFAGTLNVGNPIEAYTTKTAKNSTLNQILSLAQTANANKSDIECQIDKFIPYFVWITLSLASLSFIYWVGVNLELAILTATAVLIITCPCAFGIATPMSLAVASGIATKKHILIKNNDILSVLPKTQHFIFDKTGTLTTGKLQIKQLINHQTQMSDEQLLSLIANIEAKVNHPIAKAFSQFTSSQSVKTTCPITDFEISEGLGVSAVVDNHHYKVGSSVFLDNENININPKQASQITQLESQGKLCVCCARNKTLIAIVVLGDTLRPEAKACIDALKQQAKTIHLLTGDSQYVAKYIADELNIRHYQAQALPMQKSNYIEQLKAKNEGLIVMVGDGINDTIALSNAHGSISLASGADIATNQADVILLSNQLDAINTLLNLSNQTQTTIKQNIGLAFFYNIIMIPLAMAAYITPLIAAIAMPLSSLAVIANAAYLKKF